VFVRFGGILFLVGLAGWLYCLLDAATADRQRVRALPKGVWVAIVALTFELGAVAWLLWGRPRGEQGVAPRAIRPRLGSSNRTAWPTRPSTDRAGFGRPGPLAPDDDPEFLARLRQQNQRAEDDRLREWQSDLERRERELGPDDGDGPTGTTKS
jgi:hypothetical protein